MKLTNKWIAEGMYVTNGKQVWKVLDWDSKYRHALLQKIDKNGNKTDYFVVAENYELYGDENEALISWMNGDYLDDISQSDAEEYFDDFYKKDKKINESVEKYFVGDETAKGFEVCMMEDGKKYYLSKLAKNVVDSDWSSDHTYAKHWKDKSRAEEIVNTLNSELKESKKSITESARPIDEKNVAKFVAELNEWVDDNINYSDPEQARFTKQYGKLYDFKYDWDYTFGDKGELIVWDDGGSLNWFEDDSVKNFIVKLAKKYGWYCEPCHSSSDFMFAEL